MHMRPRYKDKCSISPLTHVNMWIQMEYCEKIGGRPVNCLLGCKGDWWEGWAGLELGIVDRHY